MTFQGLDLHLFASTFALIFFAELPDKTALSTVVMATRGRAWAVFVGTCAAFLVQSIVAVSFGAAFSLLPAHWVRIAAGALFVGMAVAMWLRPMEEEEAGAGGAEGERDVRGFARAAWKSFVVIFIAEWGDLTQLATAAIAAKNKAPLTILFSATLALWCVTGIAVIVGHRSRHLINPRLLQKAAAVLFGAIGVFLLIKGE